VRIFSRFLDGNRNSLLIPILALSLAIVPDVSRAHIPFNQFLKFKSTTFLSQFSNIFLVFQLVSFME